MNDIIIEEGYFIKEEDYQNIKKEMHFKGDYFTLTELQIFTKKLS